MLVWQLEGHCAEERFTVGSSVEIIVSPAAGEVGPGTDMTDVKENVARGKEEALPGYSKGAEDPPAYSV